MDKCFLSLNKICNKTVLFFSLFGVGSVLLLNLIFTADVSQNAAEKVSYSVSLLENIFMLIIAFFGIALIWFLKDFIKKIKINELLLFGICAAFYLLIGLYLILNATEAIRADARFTFEAALNFKNGITDAFMEGGYIYRYPNQLGLLSLDRILLNISESPRVFFGANLIFVIVTNFFSYKIADLIFKNHFVNIITILLSFAFLPHLFFILFAYGLLPGLCALIIAFCFTLRYIKFGGWFSLSLTLIFASLAALLKNNYLIGVIAIFLYILTDFFKERSFKKLIALALSLLCLILPLKLINLYYEAKADTKLNQGMPTVLWIAMGTDIDNSVRAPGWYDEGNYAIYMKSENAEVAAEKGVEKLKNNIEKIKDNPKKAAKFFLKKNVSQWCEPMLQSEWSGPLPDCKQEINTPILKSLYGGGKVNKAITLYSKFITLLLWSGAFMFLIAFKKKYKGWQLPFMFFVGGLIFHTVWEAKAQYILPYLFVLIPFAAYSLYRICAIDIKNF